MNRFAFSKILLRRLKFLFHVEFPLFQYSVHILAKFNTFQGLENQFWNSIIFSILSILRGNPDVPQVGHPYYSLISAHTNSISVT